MLQNSFKQTRKPRTAKLLDAMLFLLFLPLFLVLREFGSRKISVKQFWMNYVYGEEET